MFPSFVSENGLPAPCSTLRDSPTNLNWNRMVPTWWYFSNLLEGSWRVLADDLHRSFRKHLACGCALRLCERRLLSLTGSVGKRCVGLRRLIRDPVLICCSWQYLGPPAIATVSV